MKRVLTIFMIAAFAAAAVVMYMYWHQDSDIVNKGSAGLERMQWILNCILK